MAQRKPQKRAVVRTRVAAQPAGGDTPEAVRGERDALRAELATARAEIERLRELQVRVLNRIDWIVDSLNSLSEDGP